MLVASTYILHPISTFIQRPAAPVHLCHCAKFGIASSSIHTLGGSYAYEVFSACHVLHVLLSTGSRNRTCPLTITIDPQSLNFVRSLAPCNVG